MKKLLTPLFAGTILAFSAGVFAGDTYVQGYTKSDGTYVQGHYRSAPNSTSTDNWSTRGNVNPYTGQPGTKAPTDNGYGYGSNKSSGSKGYGQQKSQSGYYH